MAPLDPTEVIRGAQPPERLGDRYRLIERIGTGGVADVWRAFDEQLQREVALKVLHAGIDEALRRRFADEARRAAGIAHPNVVVVFDAVSNGASFIVMELVRGRSLDALLAERGRLPLREVADLVSQVGAALDAAHERGVVHCDVKPANVLIDDRGTAKLVDFGIARAAHDAGASELVGTARYLAPEVVEGKPPTPRSDVYGLGLVAYELVAGHPAFEGVDSGELLRARLVTTPEPLHLARPDVPEGVAKVVARAVARDPDARYPSAGELARALAAAIRGAERTEAMGFPLPWGGAITGFPLLWARARDALRPPFLARALAVALIAIGAVGFARALAPGAPAATPTPIPTVAPTGRALTPSVIGMDCDDAGKLLIRLGFRFPAWEVERGAGAKAGTVVRQEPAPNAPYQSGQAAKLYVAPGKKDPCDFD